MKSLIELTEEKEMKSFVKNLVIEKLVLKVKKELKSRKSETSQEMSLTFDRLHVWFMKYDS